MKRGATHDEIKTAYKSLSRKWHPDKFHTSDEQQVAHDKFIKIKDAYEKLKNIKARRKKQKVEEEKEEL